ncbi:UNVERIFIED_CONTAM: hypothetical protein HDU68_003992, partial [Siphonaria sp. JEL0065]
MRALSLEIALPSLDDETRCVRLCSRLEALSKALQEEKFLGLRKCRVSLSWFPNSPSVSFEDTDEEEGGDVEDTHAADLDGTAEEEVNSHSTLSSR